MADVPSKAAPRTHKAAPQPEQALLRVRQGRASAADVRVANQHYGRRFVQREIDHAQEKRVLTRIADMAPQVGEVAAALAVTKASADAHYRDSLRRDAEHLREHFVDPEQSIARIGAGMLRGVSDEYIADLQFAFRERYGLHLYLWLARDIHESPAQREALYLLRASYSRSPAQQEQFGEAYRDASLAQSAAATLKQAFTGVDKVLTDGDGKAAGGIVRIANPLEFTGFQLLRGQSAEALQGIRAAFQKAQNRDLLDHLINDAPRTGNSVRAIAILRHDGEAGAAYGEHVDLAANLIGEAGVRSAVMETLKRVPLAARQNIELAFAQTFQGVGPSPGLTAPDTLRGYLARTDAAWSDADHFHALSLLHHEPTDAEELYFLASGFWRSRDETLIGKLNALLAKGVRLPQLEADWKTYVQGGLKGSAPAFTTRSLRAQVEFVLTLEDQNRALAVLDAMAQREASQGLADQYRKHGDSWQADDLEAFALESAQLQAARKAIEAAAGVISNDKVVHAAIREFNRVWQSRITRLRERAQRLSPERHLLSDERPDAPLYPGPWREGAGPVSHDRHQLALACERKADDFERQWKIERVQMSSSFTGPREGLSFKSSLSLWNERGNHYAPVRLTLLPDFNAADEFYLATLDHQVADIAKLVTRLWAGNRLKQLAQDAARPRVDEATGEQLRPAFEPLKAVWSESEGVDITRARRLLQNRDSNAERGASRLDYEFERVIGDKDPVALSHASDADLGELVDFLSTPGLDDALRKQVVSIYMRIKHPGEIHVFGPDPVLAFVKMVEARFEGEAANALRLRELLAPPQSPAEMVEFAEKLKQSGQHASLAFVKSWAADRYAENISGENLRSSAERSEERLQFIASASDTQLAPLLKLNGVKTREELAHQELQTFKGRNSELRAVENTCASLVAGMVEVLVEGGAALITGGAGMAAVINAMVAAVANIAAQEAMLGSEFTTVSMENLNAVIQSGLGTAGVELDLRKNVTIAAFNVVAPGVNAMADAKGAKQFVGQMLQNVGTAAVEGGLAASSESIILSLKGKLPSDEEVAGKVYQTLSRMGAKVFSTAYTKDFNPANYQTYMAASARLKTQMIFKLSMKLTEAAAKEATSIALASGDQSLADTVLQVLWKDVRGFISTGFKAVTSTTAGHALGKSEVALVSRFAEQHPREFAIMAATQMSEMYRAKSSLQEAHQAQMRATGKPVTAMQFMQNRIAKQDDVKTRSSISKTLAEQIVLFGDTTRPGARGLMENGKTLPELVVGNKDIARVAHRQQLRENVVEQEKQLRLAAPQVQAHAAALEAQGVLPARQTRQAYERRYLSVLRQQQEADPARFANRCALLGDLMNEHSELAQALLKGDRDKMSKFLNEYGEPRSAIMMLRMGGPLMNRMADQLSLVHRTGAVDVPAGKAGHEQPIGRGARVALSAEARADGGHTQKGPKPVMPVWPQFRRPDGQMDAKRFSAALEWGTHDHEAIAKAREIRSAHFFTSKQITRAQLVEMLEYFRAVDAWTPKNPSAAGRVIYLQHAIGFMTP